jgi:hypothetical protein
MKQAFWLSFRSCSSRRRQAAAIARCRLKGADEVQVREIPRACPGQELTDWRGPCDEGEALPNANGPVSA